MLVQQTIPLQIVQESSKIRSIVLKKRNLLPNDMVSLQVGNIPVPYEAYFSIYSNLFNMQNSCVTKCNIQCINAIYLKLLEDYYVAYTWQVPRHKKYSILFNEPCSCKNRIYFSADMRYSC